MRYVIKEITYIEPFNHIEPETLEKLILDSNITLAKYSKNQIIYLQGEQCDSMGIILKGSLDINSVDEEGNVMVLSRLEKNEIIGANLLFSKNSRYPFSVTAVKDTEILKVSKDVLLEFSINNSRFTESLLQIVSDKANSLANWITQISMKSLRAKIIDYIELEKDRQKSERIILTETKKDIAKRLGVQRTSLSRELQKMKQDGILTYDRISIRLVKENSRKKSNK